MHRLRSMTDFSRRFQRLTRGGTYQPEVDGLRFLAIALVVLGHLMERMTRVVAANTPLSPADILLVKAIPWAPTGVHLFFAISGFIIASQFIRLRSSKGRFQLGAYFLRRATRIVPPYLVVLLLGYLILTFTAFRPPYVGERPVTTSLTSSLVASLLYLHGLLFGTLPRNFPPGWSLEIEVHFYILAPFIFLLYFGIRRPALRLATGLGVFLALLLLQWYLKLTFSDDPRSYYFLGHYLHHFWAGVLIADATLCLPGGTWREHRAWGALGVLGLLALLVSGILQHGILTPNYASMLEVLRVGAIVLLFLGVLSHGGLKRLFGHRVLSFIGGTSYSIYLCHLHVMQVAAAVLAASATFDNLFTAYLVGLLVSTPLVLGSGLAFYLLIERPCMDPAWPVRLLDAIREAPRQMARRWAAPRGEGRLES